MAQLQKQFGMDINTQPQSNASSIVGQESLLYRSQNQTLDTRRNQQQVLGDHAHTINQRLL